MPVDPADYPTTARGYRYPTAINDGGAATNAETDPPADLKRLADDVDADVTAVEAAAGSASGTVASDLAAHVADSTGVHGIADTSVLVTSARQVIAGTGLTGGGTLAADRTLAVAYGTSAGTAAQGNDARLSDTRTPTDGSVTTAKIAAGGLAKTAVTGTAITATDTGTVTDAMLADGAVTAAKAPTLAVASRIGNRATSNQAVFDTDLSGWNTSTGTGLNNVTGCTFTRDTGVTINGYPTMKVVYDGAYSLQGCSVNITGLKPSTTYTVVATMKASGSSRGCRIYVRGATDAISTTQTSATATGHRVTVETGPDATSLLVSAQGPSGTGTGETFHFTQFGVWEGSGGVWDLPGAPVFGVTPANGAVAATQLAADAVTTVKILDGAVTPAKMSVNPDPTGLLSVTLSTGSTDTLTYPNGMSQTLTDLYGVRQVYRVLSGANVLQSGGDDLAPIWLSTGAVAFELYGGNHRPYTWVQAAGTLTTADVGKVWTDGSYFTTLLNVTGGNAWWSQRHNVGVTAYSSTAMTGTWTCTATGPDLVWSSPTITSNIDANKSVSDTGVNWATGTPLVAARRVVQTIAAYEDIILAQQASVGTVIAASAAATLGVLTSEWRWYGDQPGVAIVDVTFAAAKAVTVKQWSGLQMSAASGLAGTAVVGLVPGHPLVGWTASLSSVQNTLLADWADATHPPAWLTRGTYGGGAVGILSSSLPLASAYSAGEAGSPGYKLYPSAVGYGGTGVALSPGQTATVHGWRSATIDTHDRHVHVVKDPDTGVVRWFLMAGTTGAATHAALARHVGRRVKTTRGTGALDTIVTTGGTVTVTTAGWAEGVIV